ncbi:MAG: Zn-ribbon domain-containing OB-fold protein [Candidatus Rokubacteria bacterium]|nr:Zn-ribbon domain-containing OB-fold protein [Candidatus Rokubacteria bacterium]
MTERVVHLKGFFEEARAGRLTGIRCGRCGELAIPPREFCPACQGREWHPVPLSGEGTVTSFTVIRVAPRSHAGQAPYAVAQVRLAEGLHLLGRVVEVPLESLAIGLPVRFRPLLEGEQTAIGFGPG